ncbi:AAA family ATPase [Wukongibacter baidiensis]
MDGVDRYTQRKDGVELCYIWIKNYKDIIVEQGFNFGGRNIYRYKNNMIYKEKNENYINNFFGESIVNITGIVGRNGSGKSTILDFIKENLTNNLGRIKDKAIIILNIRGKEVIYKNSELKIKNSSDFNIETYCIDKKTDITNSYNEFNTSLVYFSNVFDLKHYKRNNSNDLEDISTKYFLSMDKYTNYEEHENTKIGEIEAHKVAELTRQITFNFEYESVNKIMDFSIPNEIEVIPIEIDYLSILQDFDYLPEEDSGFDIIYEFLEKLKKANSEKTSDKYIYKIILLLLENLLYIFKEFANKYVVDIIDFLVEEIDRVIKSKKGIIEEFKIVFENIEKHVEDMKIYKSKLKIEKEHLKMTLKGSKNLYNFICNRKENEFIKGKLILDNKKDIQNILSFYHEAIYNVRILEFKWRNLSSGQSALLSMFSRLYYGKNNLKENIILLIDEGELYFHPQWQKKLIKYLVDYLPEIYSIKRNIQVILTSNSPFIISDLPKNNIIFLENNSDKCIVYDGLEDKKQTFAANIHTLLMDSFFMDNTIGEFAKNKISEVVEILNSDISKIREKKKEIRNTINMIGEPIIKNKLLSMLEDKLKLELLDVDEEMYVITNKIIELEQRLKMLEGNKND